MNICKDCKNYDEFRFLCVRGKRQVGIDPIQGAPVFKYDVLDYVWEQRESILPWRCGKKGRHFEPKVAA
jgi:hypothetical protein